MDENKKRETQKTTPRLNKSRRNFKSVGCKQKKYNTNLMEKF